MLEIGIVRIDLVRKKVNDFKISFVGDDNFLPSFCKIDHKFVIGNKFLNLIALLESGLPETLNLENLIKRQV